MTSVWRLGQNILKHTPPTVRFLWMRDREKECKNKTLPSIQYSVSAGNTLLRWNKVGSNFRFTQTLKYTPLSVYVRDAFRISTWSLSRGLCFQVRNSRHSLFFCWRLSNSVALLQAPPSGLGWIVCIRHKASCTEPRCLYRDGSVRIHVSCHP